jgi:thioredoxin reductase
MDNQGGFTAEQIVQMMAEIRKNKGRNFSKKARLSRYPYRGQSAVVSGAGGGAADGAMDFSESSQSMYVALLEDI